jgi:hypothetical protein
VCLFDICYESKLKSSQEQIFNGPLIAFIRVEIHKPVNFMGPYTICYLLYSSNKDGFIQGFCILKQRNKERKVESTN